MTLEALARRMYQAIVDRLPPGHMMTWETAPERVRDEYRALARVGLDGGLERAAAVAEARDANLRSHALYPAGGLRERAEEARNIAERIRDLRRDR